MNDDILRKSVRLPRSLWERVSVFHHDRRLKSEREAVHVLLEAGLDAMQKKPARAGRAKE
jgi:hypothetical protein